LTCAIEQRIMMAKFENPYLASVPVPVKNVYPCEDCGSPVVLIRLGRDVKLVDAIKNPFSQRWWAPWEADPVIGDHHCAGCCQ
jgi:hypothetical protein